MEKTEAKKKGALQPMPKVIVSCRGNDGTEDALVVAYCGNCSFDPPMVMVGIVPSRYSYHLIKESKCFVVNIPEKSFKDTYDYMGSVSRRDTDKLADQKVKLENGKAVNAPVMLDCPVNIECSVVDSVMTGSHEMFIGKVEYVHADKSLVDKDGNIDFSKLNIIK